jgi:hypothetical protein
MRRRRRRSRGEPTARIEDEMDVASLQERARDLRDELETIEEAIERLAPQAG